MGPGSERLEYRRLTRALIPVFHALAVDPHVRRYLLDGAVVDRAWCEAEVDRSDALFEARSVGLWLLERERVAIGLAGFRVYEEHDDTPQLLYALTEASTGHGYAIEAARACIAFAGWPEIVAAVDAPNVRSIALLTKLGFERDGEWPGAFGPTFRFVLR